MESKTNFSGRLKQFDGLTRLTLTPHILRQMYATGSNGDLIRHSQNETQWVGDDRPSSSGAVAVPARVDVTTSVYVGPPQPARPAARDAAFERPSETARTARPAQSRAHVATLRHAHTHTVPTTRLQRDFSASSG